MHALYTQRCETETTLYTGGGVDKLTKSSNSKIFGGSARDED